MLDRHGERFLSRIFTDVERARAERRSKRAEVMVATYAKRFAAKEACSKALGTGIMRGVWWRDMGVVNLPGGRPTMALTGGALKRLQTLTPEGIRGPHRPDHHRRMADGAGDGHHFGRSAWDTAIALISGRHMVVIPKEVDLSTA